MRAELRQLLTIEHGDLAEAYPVDDAFCVSLRALIGAVGEPGEESFDFDVCSPAWLQRELELYPVLSGRFTLIVADYNPSAIETYVRKRVAQATGPDWPTVAGILARWSRWEFEDYSG